MDLALGVVPIHVHFNVERSGPIDGADIVFVENFGEMVGVFFANIFNAKVVDAEGEGDAVPIVLPEAQRGRAVMVAMFVESSLSRFWARMPACWRPYMPFGILT